MFGSKSLSLPSPFPSEHRPQRLYSEPIRPQPVGQCHFLIQYAGTREQRCPCQGYQHNRSASGSLCDCNHLACYHAQNPQNDLLSLQDSPMNIGSPSSNLAERIRRLEETVQIERDMRETLLARERQSWEMEIRVLREALTPFYKSEHEMRQRLGEIEENLDQVFKEQTQTNARISAVEDAGVIPQPRARRSSTATLVVDQRTQHHPNEHDLHEVSVTYPASEGQISASCEPLSPKQLGNIVTEPESPRSSGILNLIELPRPALPKHIMPPRLSPPPEADEPRSSGFLALDVKELIHRRKLALGAPASQIYGSPISFTAKSTPPNPGILTPQSLPRVSPPGFCLNDKSSSNEDRTNRKRKAGLMALDVLADVSAASPVIS